MAKLTGITSFRILDFKSYHDADLQLSPLTLLIGANASGKSNLIEALRLLSWLGHGKRLDEIARGILDHDVSVRGALRDLSYHGVGQFGFSCNLTSTTPVEWLNLRVDLFAGDSGLRIVAESVRDTARKIPLYAIDHPAKGLGHDVLVTYDNFAKGKNKPKAICTDQQLILTQLSTPAPFSTGHAKSRQVIPAVCNQFMESLGNMFFLDPAPRLMRGYSFTNDKALREDGVNVSSVLNSIVEKGQKKQILDFVRSLPEQDIMDISFIHTPRNEVMVQLAESFAGHKETRDAPLLSDGTLRVLAIAAMLLSAPSGATVIIEEIDNGVHPSRAKHLLENILRASTDRNLKVLVTTHNPALLDALPMDAIPNVACCYRDPKKGDSRLVHVKDMASSAELLAQGPLGFLMTSGILDRFLKDSRTSVDKTRDALKWLEEQEAKR